MSEKPKNDGIKGVIGGRLRLNLERLLLNIIGRSEKICAYVVKLYLYATATS